MNPLTSFLHSQAWLLPLSPFPSAVVEQVVNGSTFRAFLFPSDISPTYQYVTLLLSGVRAPSARPGEDKETYEDEAKFFVESRLLQRDVQIILEGVEYCLFLLLPYSCCGSLVHVAVVDLLWLCPCTCCGRWWVGVSLMTFPTMIPLSCILHNSFASSQAFRTTTSWERSCIRMATSPRFFFEKVSLDAWTGAWRWFLRGRKNTGLLRRSPKTRGSGKKKFGYGLGGWRNAELPRRSWKTRRFRDRKSEVTRRM